MDAIQIESIGWLFLAVAGLGRFRLLPKSLLTHGRSSIKRSPAYAAGGFALRPSLERRRLRVVIDRR